MTPETIIRDATDDGVTMALTDEGTIRLHGDKASVAKWTPMVRDHKAALLETLKAANALPDPGMEARRQSVLCQLREHPAVRYAFETKEEPGGDMRVALAVRDVGTCELVIARDRWDPFLFVELLRQHEGSA